MREVGSVMKLKERYEGSWWWSGSGAGLLKFNKTSHKLNF